MGHFPPSRWHSVFKFFRQIHVILCFTLKSQKKKVTSTSYTWLKNRLEMRDWIHFEPFFKITDKLTDYQRRREKLTQALSKWQADSFRQIWCESAKSVPGQTTICPECAQVTRGDRDFRRPCHDQCSLTWPLLQASLSNKLHKVAFFLSILNMAVCFVALTYRAKEWDLNC